MRCPGDRQKRERAMRRRQSLFNLASHTLSVLTLIVGLLIFSLQSEAALVDDYLKLAEQGDAQAQYSLAVMYGKGQGVERDPPEAVKWLTKAAEQGLAQ